MERIAVIMTVHNRRETTLECLRHLFRQVDAPMPDVYLTDDGCTDGTADAVAEEFPDVNVLKGSGSLFWNGGMRFAWEEAVRHGYEAYLWLNDDTMLLPDAMSVLLRTSAAFSDRAVILGSTCDSETRSRVTYGGRDGDGQPVMPGETALGCVYMNGNIVLIPRHVVDAIGLNDTRYTHSLGDYDYGMRAREAGLDVMVAPGFLGVCDLHEHVPVWSDPSKPLKVRWRSLFSPTGSNPFELFYYRRRHFGLIPACMTFVSNMVHVLFPSLWRPMETSADGRKKLLVFHPALLPYRVDFFNRLASDYEARIVFLQRNNRNQHFDQAALEARCTFTPEYLDRKLVVGDRDFNLGYLRMIRCFRPDIVLGSEYGMSVLVPVLVRKLFGFRYKVWTVCDDSLDIASARRGLRGRMRDMLMKHIDGVILTSQGLVDWYSSHVKTEAEFAVLPIIREDGAFRRELSSSLPTAIKYLDNYGLKGRKVVLYVGRLAEVKNLPFLIRAFAAVAEADARLVLVGDGDRKEALKAEAERLGCAGRVLFPGRFEGEALLAWYHVADLFVLPSTYEPFGTVTAEALQSGLPVLCSSAAGSASLINGENGQLFSPYDIESLKEALKTAMAHLDVRTGYDALRESRLDCSFSSYMDQLKTMMDR